MVTVLAGGLIVTGGAGPAAADAIPADHPAHDRVVSEDPASWTPQIRDGKVRALAQTGNTMVAGGTFTEVSPWTGNGVLARTNIVAFNATTGAINTGFNPSITGQVEALAPGPTSDTVIIAGAFGQVNGVAGKVFLLNVNTGQTVATFKAPGMNGAPQDLVKAGNRLFVGGNFTAVGNTPHAGFATLNATTGALDPFMDVNVAEHHNYTGQDGEAIAPVGVRALDVSPDGRHLVAIGNFKKVDGLDRDQIVMLDLTGPTAEVRPDWRTRRYEPRCSYRSFDYYVRDVSIAPDGSSFNVASTGAPYPGTLCDTVTQWSMAATGDAVEPTWVDDTGGDTIFSVANSGAAVYNGGHQRWMNNAGGTDSSAAGAVPRPGMGADDPRSGTPLSWNPGRQPRGIGAEALLVTPAGLWVGSDTNYIGNQEHWRPRIAFFPLAGGKKYGPGAGTQLPANVYSAGTNPPATNFYHRINAGGPTLTSLDSGPNWSSDNSLFSSVHNFGSSTSSYPAVPAVDATVSDQVPRAVFDTERYDPSSSPEMIWTLPVPNGQPVDIRLFFANRSSSGSQPGQRVFDVLIENVTRLDDFDIAAAAGHATGTMRQFSVVSDGSIRIEFRHVTGNPLINGIEVVKAGSVTPPSAFLASTKYDGVTTPAAPTAAPAGPINWGAVRGATMIDDELFYNTSDGVFHRRTFDGTTYGPDQLIDPYTNTEWTGVPTGSGSSVYTGKKPTYYTDIPNIRGMAYLDGRLYYTKTGSSQIVARRFSPESAIQSNATTTVPNFSVSNVQSIFFSGSWLYYTNSSTGTLSRVEWVNGAPQGTATVVSGPGVDSLNWSSRTVFPGPTANQLPTATIANPACTDLDCGFDGSGSSDPDGSIASYAWSFGDGAEGTGAQPNHSYTAAGEYTVTLTVTDNRGGQASTTRAVKVTAPNQKPVAVIAAPQCSGLSCNFDGSGSTDADGTIVSYAWDFGDGTNASGATASREFAAAGGYQVKLTVTDNQGGVGTATVPVSVGAAQFAAGAMSTGNTTAAKVTIPAGVQPGDALLLFVTTNSLGQTSAPAGAGTWALEHRREAASMATTLYSKVAVAGDAGKELTLTSALQKIDLQLVAYRGGSASDPVATVASAADVTTASHTTPVATVSGGGQLAVSFWADKSSSTTDWTAPAGVTVRAEQLGDGSGRLTTLLADAEVPGGAATYGGKTATTDQTSSRGVMYTVLLAPAG
jgi:PKD repeat protein